jgi:hypothetical protein
MKNFLLFLGLISIFSCEKEVVQRKDVVKAKQINAVVLTVDSFTKYSSINEDWFSIASNNSYNVSTEFFNNDSLGNITNLTNMIIDSNYTIEYKLYPSTKSNITILDKNKTGNNLGLLFNIKTTTPEFGFMDVKVYNNKCESIFKYQYSFIVATP